MPRYMLRRKFFHPGSDILVKKIAQFKSDDVSQIITFFSSFDFLVDKKTERKKLSESLANQISDITPQEADQVFDLIVDVLENLNREEFDENVVVDSLSIEDFVEENKKTLISLMREIHKGTNYYDMVKIRSYKSTGPDELQAFDWAVDFRAVFKKGYKSDEKIVEYEPKIEDLIPMVILEFVGSIPFHISSFQIDEKDLDKLINQLLAAQKQLIAMKKVWEEKNA